MEGDQKELRVNNFDSLKKVMFFAKQFLLKSDTLNLVASTNSIGTAAGAAETLKRLGYVTYGDIQTETVIDSNTRRSRCIIVLKKTKDFQTLYNQHEENKKKYEEERKQKSEAQEKK